MPKGKRQRKFEAKHLQGTIKRRKHLQSVNRKRDLPASAAGATSLELGHGPGIISQASIVIKGGIPIHPSTSGGGLCLLPKGSGPMFSSTHWEVQRAVTSIVCLRPCRPQAS